MAEVPVWPKELPQRVLSTGFSRTYDDGVQATSMGAGVQKTRLQTVAAPEQVQASIMATEEGIARFRRFRNEEVGRGSLPFLMPDQVCDGASITASDGTPLLTAGGQPLMQTSWWLVMFTPGSPPRDGENRGLEFTITFQLTILP
jgi:hypothetical protein